MGFLDSITRSIQRSNRLTQTTSLIPSSADLNKPVLKETPSYPALVINPETKNQPILSPGNTADYQNLFGQASTVYTAVGVISQSIAQLPVKLIQTDSEGVTVDIPLQDIFSIFRTYNEYQTHYDFWEQTIGFLELTGECPLLINRDKSGSITGMFPIRPDLIKIIPSTEFLVDHYVFEVSGKSVDIPRDEILFLKYFNPNSAHRGMSPISAAKNDIILDLHASTSAKSQFSRGAQPSGMVSTEQDMSESDWERTQNYLREQYSGSDNAGKIMFLSHGLKWQQTAISNHDMQFMEQRQWTRDTISAVYGVPPIFLMQFKEASVLANADVQYKLLWENIKPKLIKLEQIITEFILPQITKETNISFKFDLKNVSPLQPDFDSRASRYKTGFAIGAVTPNEYLVDVLDKEPIDDPAMNLHYIPANVIPLNTSAEGVLNGTTADDESVENAVRRLQERVDEVLIPSKQERISKSISIAKNKLYISNDKANAIEQMGDLFRIQNKLVKKHLPVFLDILQQIKTDVVREILSMKIYDRDKALNKDMFALFQIIRFAKMFQDAGGKLMFEGVKIAGQDLAFKLGYGTFNLQDPNIDAYVNERSIEYAGMVTETFSNEIDDLVRAGLRDGLTIEEIAGSVTGFFENQASYRAERIARTEAVRSTNKGRMLSMKQGDVTYHMWISQRDGKVRDAHGFLDGEIVKVGEDFPVGTGYNGDASYPSDINERCGTIPVSQPVL